MRLNFHHSVRYSIGNRTTCAVPFTGAELGSSWFLPDRAGGKWWSSSISRWLASKCLLYVCIRDPLLFPLSRRRLISPSERVIKKNFRTKSTSSIQYVEKNTRVGYIIAHGGQKRYLPFSLLSLVPRYAILIEGGWSTKDARHVRYSFTQRECINILYIALLYSCMGLIKASLFP